MKLSEAEFERQYIEATRRGEEELRTQPLAQAVRFDARTRRVIIDTNKGFTISVPTDLLQGMRGASVKDLSQVEILGVGQAIEWPTMDQQFSMTGLLSGVFGNKAWMAELRPVGRRARPKTKAKSPPHRRGGMLSMFDRHPRPKTKAKSARAKGANGDRRRKPAVPTSAR